MLAVCLLTGCWEKIEYRGTDPATEIASPQQTPPTTVSEAPSNSHQAAEGVGERYAENGEGQLSTTPATSAEPPATQAGLPDTRTEVRATPTAATEVPTVPAINTKRAAWILGSRFCLAVLANERGVASEEVPKWLDETRTMAEVLNVPLAEMPVTTSQPPSEMPSHDVLRFILNEEKAIGPKLAAGHGDDHEALFRLAVRMNLLRVLNTPGSKAVETLSNSIADLGPRTGLPADVWQPLLDVLREGATSAAIRTAVPQTHEKIEQHLAAEP